MNLTNTLLGLDRRAGALIGDPWGGVHVVPPDDLAPGFRDALAEPHRLAWSHSQDRLVFRHCPSVLLRSVLLVTEPLDLDAHAGLRVREVPLVRHALGDQLIEAACDPFEGTWVTRRRDVRSDLLRQQDD